MDFQQVSEFIGTRMGIQAGRVEAQWKESVLALAIGLLLWFWCFAVPLLQLLFLLQKAAVLGVPGSDSYVTVWEILGLRLHQFLPHQFAMGLP